VVRVAAGDSGGVDAMEASDGRATPASTAASRAARERADETRATWRRTKAAPNAPRCTPTQRAWRRSPTRPDPNRRVAHAHTRGATRRRGVVRWAGRYLTLSECAACVCRTSAFNGTVVLAIVVVAVSVGVQTDYPASSWLLAYVDLGVQASPFTVLYITVQCSAVQCSAVQCSAVQYSTVRYIIISTWECRRAPRRRWDVVCAHARPPADGAGGVLLQRAAGVSARVAPRCVLVAVGLWCEPASRWKWASCVRPVGGAAVANSHLGSMMVGAC